MFDPTDRPGRHLQHRRADFAPGPRHRGRHQHRPSRRRARQARMDLLALHTGLALAARADILDAGTRPPAYIANSSREIGTTSLRASRPTCPRQPASTRRRCATSAKPQSGCSLAAIARKQLDDASSKMIVSWRSVADCARRRCAKKILSWRSVADYARRRCAKKILSWRSVADCARRRCAKKILSWRSVADCARRRCAEKILRAKTWRRQKFCGGGRVLDDAAPK